MTDKEKAIVMAYTGIAMLTGEKFSIFHEYVEEIMKRPVQTLELAFNAEEIKRRATPDFIRLCRKTTADAHGHWELREGYNRLQRCSACGYKYNDLIECDNFCGNCGAKMDEKKDSNGNWIYMSLEEVIDNAD